MWNLKQIEQLFIEKDIEGLDLYATAKKRTINRSMNFRSALMLSANNFKHLVKIPELKSDAIILNLEDGVSREEKPLALVLSAIFLSHYEKLDKKLIVRVNALDEGGFDEIAYLNQFKPDAIRVPKIQNPQDVQKVLHLLDEDIELHLSIETASAWKNLSALAIDKRVTTFYLGALDLLADMKLSQSLISLENPTFLYILSHFLVTCKALHVKAVCFVYQEFQKLDEFHKWLELEKEMGYDATGCISPKQAEMANEMFIDNEAELERAKVIVKLFEMNQELGITGFVDNEYGFIDEPIYKDALNKLR